MSNPIHSSLTPLLFVISDVYTELGKGFRQRDSGSEGLEGSQNKLGYLQEAEVRPVWLEDAGRRQLEMTLDLVRPVGFVMGLVYFLSVVGMKEVISIFKRSH